MTSMDPFRLDDVVAVVTGGNRGLGAGVCRALVEAGAVVAVTARNEDAAEEEAAQLRSQGGKAHGFALDVTDGRSIDAALEQIEAELGPIGVLVNNAGVGSVWTAFETPSDGWRSAFATNVDGVWECSRAVARRMIDHDGGAIVNVGSIGAFRVLKRPQAAYMASKAAVHQLTRALAAEWVEHGIRVNAVAPGPFMTDMTKPYVAGYAQIQELTYGEPHQLGPAVVFLASRAAAFVTGEILTVDGGASL